MIELAKTNEQYKKCLEYLSVKGTNPMQGSILFFIEAEGEIKACAGWHPDLGGTIEPLQSEHRIYTQHLGYFMMGFIIGKGYNHITCWTENEDWINILQKSGYSVWSKSTQLVKGI